MHDNVKVYLTALQIQYQPIIRRISDKLDQVYKNGIGSKDHIQRHINIWQET